MNSIAKKVMLILMFAFIPLFLLVAGISYQLTNNNESEQWQHTQKNISNQLQIILQEPVYAYDKPLIKSIIDSFVEDQNLSSIQVFDHREQLLGETNLTALNRNKRIVLPLVWSEKSIGSVKVQFSDSLTEQRIISGVLNAIYALVITLALVIFLTLMILKRVVISPLTQVIHLLEDIAHGGGDLTKRIQYQAKDEIGRVVSGFNFFVAEVQNIIQDLALTSSGIEQVSSLVKDAGINSKNEANAQLKLTEAGIEHLTQLTQATRDITLSASQAAENTTQAHGLSSVSSSSMTDNLSQIDRLVTELNGASTIVNQVHLSSENITSVLDVIKNIAEQTNLLALNAAIEAARAGESGRGFSVVADEVRALASKTHQSTAEIESIIASLQQQVGHSVEATEKSKSLAVVVIESSRETHTSLHSITGQMDKISDMNNMIASASEEQTMVTSGVSDSMSLIHKGAQGLASQANSLEKTIVQLSQLEKTLSDKIDQFKY